MEAVKAQEVNLLGQNFMVTNEPGSIPVDTVVAYVRPMLEQLQAQSPTASPLRLALAVTLNVAKDYLETSEEHKHLKEQVEDKAANLLKLLDDMALQ